MCKVSILYLDHVPEFRQQQAQILHAARRDARPEQLKRMADRSKAQPVVSLGDFLEGR